MVGTESRGRQGTSRTVLLLAAVLALDHADRTTLGVVAPSLEHDFHIGTTQIGLLASAFSIIGGLATIPAGVLTDRVRRTSLLAVSIVGWSVASFFTGAAPFFAALLIARSFLGVVAATNGPTTASLIGDLVSQRERSQALAKVQIGQYVGTGIAFAAAGVIADVFSWRWAFWVLVPTALVLARLVWRMPEPDRTSHREADGSEDREDGEGREPHHGETLIDLVESRSLRADPRLVLRGHQEERSLFETVRYLFLVRTNLVLVFAATVGNIFFAGVSTFGVLFLVRQYGISRSMLSAALPVAGLGAAIGLIGSGKLADHLLKKGLLPARIRVAAVAHVVAGAALLPAVLMTSFWFALPLLVIGGASLAGAGPLLDAARLDVVHPDLWGRAEGVRTVVRTAGEGAAPLALGWVAATIGGPDEGLGRLALILLPFLFANAWVLWLAARHYGNDVKAVLRSVGVADPSDPAGSEEGGDRSQAGRGDAG